MASDQSAVLLGTGLGLLTEAVILLVPGRPPRLAAALGVVTAGTLGAGVRGPEAGWAAAGLTAGAALLTWATATAGPALLVAVRPARVRAVGAVTVGLAVFVGAVARDDARHRAALDGDTAWMVKVGHQPDVEPAAGVQARTDRGYPVVLGAAVRPRAPAALAAREAEVLAGLPTAAVSFRRGPASDACNCHGWVFAGGRYWVGPADVTAILAGNGYAPVDAPRPGDLAVYRRDGEIVHTAIVRMTGPGLPVLVEGKWAWLGVYLHPAGQSTFGPDVGYYRSPRAGHRLAGLDP
jgi:hypothetical protein